MNTLPEFFQGLIARDLQEILTAEADEEKKKKKKKPSHPHEPPKSTKTCSVSNICPQKTTKTCSVPTSICRQKTTQKCSVPVIRCPKKKADVFAPGIPGWSCPPAPPAF
jgi:hypothetical protein